MHQLHKICTLTFISLFAAVPASAKNHPAQSHALLYEIKTPRQLVYPLFPKRYVCEVELSGDLATEIKEVIEQIDLESPRFMESFDSRKGFSLYLSNDSYPEQTKSMLAGILNPVDMIDVILESLMKFKEPIRLKHIISQTEMSVVDTLIDSMPTYKILLTPAGDTFNYEYQDYGAVVEESWVTRMELLVDSASKVIRELRMKKYSRRFDQLSSAPEPKLSNHRYTFGYQSMHGKPIPSEMILDVDNQKRIKLSASYRLIDNKLVFGSRSICFAMPEDSAHGCLHMHCSNHVLGKKPESKFRRRSSSGYIKDFRKASLLSQKASEQIRTGNISGAMRTLKILTNNYPETPQAAEARKMLSSFGDN